MSNDTGTHGINVVHVRAICSPLPPHPAPLFRLVVHLCSVPSLSHYVLALLLALILVHLRWKYTRQTNDLSGNLLRTRKQGHRFWK